MADALTSVILFTVNGWHIARIYSIYIYIIFPVTGGCWLSSYLFSITAYPLQVFNVSIYRSSYLARACYWQRNLLFPLRERTQDLRPATVRGGAGAKPTWHMNCLESERSRTVAFGVLVEPSWCAPFFSGLSPDWVDHLPVSTRPLPSRYPTPSLRSTSTRYSYEVQVF